MAGRTPGVSKLKSYGRRNLYKSIFFVLFFVWLSFSFEAYNQGQIAVTLMLFIAVASIVLLTGLSGQISLGQGALMAIGGYGSALLIVNQNFPIWAALIGSIIIAFVSGLILGVIAARLSGPYLAGTTLVIALAIPTIANRFESVLAGNIGFLVDFKSPPAWVTSIFGELGYEHWQLIATLPFAALTFFFISNILKSRSGRSWKALRDNETAASLLGLKISHTKVLVFAVSSAFAGLAGALYGLRGIVGPSVYAVSLSLSLLTAAILGGVRSIFGALLGTLIIVFLPDWIHDVVKALELSEQVSNFLPAFFAGALLVLTVVINPGGIASNLHHHKK